MMPAIQIVYFITAILFIMGLKKMSSPLTAKSGINWGGCAMGIAVLATFAWPGLRHFPLMIIALALGGIAAWISGRRVPMTDMPQMIAVYNGMGGGAAACIAAIELSKGDLAGGLVILAVAGALIGSVSFSGSVVAFLRLQRIMNERPLIFWGQKGVNLAVLAAALISCGYLFQFPSSFSISLFFGLCLAFGVMMTLPIGGGDMPVVISLYNALTGMAVAFDGFALGNSAMIIGGTVVGAAGTMLTMLMAKAMNRSIASVLFGGFGTESADTPTGTSGSLKPIDVDDAAILMAYAEKVVIVPGYGMAVAQAQHKVQELCHLLMKRGVTVKYAIHPVAGRMPGHMNVLLAEANVPYEKLFDLEEINPEFAHADVSLVIGANDVVNPAARTNSSSPIYGMPILDVDKSKNVLVIKRGKGKGFAGIENELFFKDNTRMLYGDAQDIAGKLAAALKRL